MNASPTPPTGLEIAVVGMSGRFPRAANIDAYWRNLCQGVEAISTFTDEELVAAGVDPQTLAQPNYVKAAAVLDAIEQFDADFFGYNPREAEIMDPQQRIFLEEAWQALEHAGYDPDNYSGPIGVYAGAGSSSYLLNALASAHHSQFLTLIGNDKDFLTTRVSYKLNLTGPSINVQTACSTSLVAVHLACQGLLSGECDMALAGGVAIKTPQKAGYLYEEGGILSPDGRCRAFDAHAQGTVVGNGIGLVVLKRLQDALDDGDTIYAVIKGTAVNNDGSMKVGYTAPSVEGQAAVIRAAQFMAEVDPATIGFVEAHGTGTALGDPIEMAALTQVFRAATSRAQFCAVGSVKTNMGHLDTAAGIAGLIKAVLSLNRQLIPPTLHFERPNPQINFAASPFFVNAALTPWPDGEAPRRAAVSSFGIGGSNAHAILEEAPAPPASGPSRPWQLLVLSAQTPSALDKRTANLADYLQRQPDCNLADVAYTLQVGRKAMAHRRAFICRDTAEARSLLENPVSERLLTAFQEQNERPIIFMFPGQGAQYVNMGRELYETEPIYRDAVDQCARLLRVHLGFDLRAVLYPSETEIDAATDRLGQTAVTQPALFVVEYALAQLFLSWGVRPQAMIGHSIGEYVAACLAGVFSLTDGLALVAARGQLMQEMPAGAMLSVPLSETELAARLPATLSLAAANAPDLCVVSGPSEAVQTMADTLQAEGVPAKLLRTSHAFHSAMMDPILVSFRRRVEQVDLQPPKLPFLSNVSGDWITAVEATDPDYWTRHLRQTVCFASGIERLLADPAAIFLEVGPGRALTTLVRRQTRQGVAPVSISSLPHPQEAQSDGAHLLTSLARLWLAGAKIDWAAFSASEQRRRIPLPTYPFEPKRYWLDAPKNGVRAPVETSLADERQPLDRWFYTPAWKIVPPIFPPPAPPKALRWLVLLNEAPFGRHLCQALADQGQQLIVVEPGQAFAVLEDGRYALNPHSARAYEQLLTDLAAKDQLPQRILHLWLADDTDRSPNQWRERGLDSLIYLAQALDQVEAAAPMQIDLITSQCYDVSGNEPLQPDKATALAAVRVIPQEHHRLSCRHIDLAMPTANGSSQRALASQILAELFTSEREPATAYRGNSRWQPVYNQLALAAPDGRSRLRQGGVYLFSGGADESSQALAEYLAQAAQARLVFLETPTATAEAIAARQQRIQALEEAGARVLCLPVDLSDAEQVAEAIAAAERRFGAIRGVLHTAAPATPEAFTIVQETNGENLARHFKPKVDGLLSLQKGLRGREIDFWLLHSSLASILGGIRYLGQAAADLYLDSAAVVLGREMPGDWIAVNWDAQQPVTGESLRPSDKLALSREELSAVFARIMAAPPTSQIIVSTRDFAQRLREWQNGLTAVTAPKDISYERPAHLLTPFMAPRNDLETVIVAVWETLLGISPIGVYDNFFELGGHSLLMIQAATRLREQFPVELPQRQLFEAQTAADLAIAVVQGLAEQEEDADLLALLNEIEEPVRLDHDDNAPGAAPGVAQEGVDIWRL